MIATRKSVARSTVRVAVYTRKSVAEGLEQEFNSLDAQREAVEAYVASQRGAGWAALPERYDDGGFSGATIERPAFQRLLREVEAGKVDVVACYKLDRVSRSLLDFTQLLDLFRRHGVGFVSVTQSFDTSTPMGRMVVNLLASFAEFERETIAERVKDKIAASRRRGMWTGGRPVLGFDLVAKKLVVNEEEAARVRAIFALYRELGSTHALAHELRTRGWTTKSFTRKDGSPVPGRRFTKASVRTLLTNPLYAGRMRAGAEQVEGAQAAIIDQTIFDETQALLAEKAARPRGWRPPGRSGAVLKGLLSCTCGSSMTFTFTLRRGRHYGYYVCARVLKEGASKCPGSRAPAGELEAFVLERVRAVGRDPRVLEATLVADRSARDARRPELEAEVRRFASERGRLSGERGHVVEAIGRGGTGLVTRLAELDGEIAEVDRRAALTRGELEALDLGVLDPDELRRALAEFEPLWEQLVPKERARVLALLLERVEFDPASGEVAITFRPGGPRLLAAENTCPASGAVPGNGQANH